MTDEFKKRYFHDQYLLNIRKEGNDVIIEVDDDMDNEYVVKIENAMIERNIMITKK